MSAPRRHDRWQTRAGEWVLFQLAQLFRRATHLVPLWPLEGAFGKLGGLLALMLPATRRRAGANLDLVWPDLDPTARRALIRSAGEHFMRLMVEYAHLGRLVSEAEISVEGGERLVAAGQRGAILVTAHYGNWEAARLAARNLGVECGIIYRAFNNRYLDRYTVELIKEAGEPVLQKGAAGMRQLLTHVSKGGTVMILVDQRTTGAPEIPFLGVPAETVTVAADVARRYGAPLIPVVARRNVAERRFDVIFEPPVEEGSALAMTAEMNRRISAWIEEEPGQWLWFHRRWKRASAALRQGS